MLRNTRDGTFSLRVEIKSFYIFLIYKTEAKGIEPLPVLPGPL